MKEIQPCVLEGPCPGFRCVNKAVTSRQRDVDFIRAVRYVSWVLGGVQGGTRGLEKDSETSRATADTENFTSQQSVGSG